jgi:opacity protein-like surface antigen
MKKIFSILLMAACSFAIALPAQAQLIKWGVKGGVNLSKIDLDGNLYDGNKGNKTGFFIGPMAEITVPIIGLGVNGSLLFSQRGAKLNGKDVKQTGLEIPVNLKYTIGMGSVAGIYFAAGPDFFFNFAGDKSVDKFDFKKKKAQVGLNLGAGLELVKHLQIGVNYQLPLGDSFTLKNAVDAATKSDNAKLKTWQVSAAYIF